MSSFYKLLNKIKQKPGIYIGAPSVSSLHMFLCGYAFSRQEQGLAITKEEKAFEQFQPWIQRRFQTNDSISWARIILLYAADERAGFDLFFKLWAEFVDQQRQRQQEELEKVVA